MPHTYLYIPFSQDEGSADLERLALKWVARTALSAKSHKMPEIIQHGEIDDDTKFAQNCTIYILGHGVDEEDIEEVGMEFTESLKHSICTGSALQDPKVTYLTMKEVAKRIKEDGLEAKFNAKIKLFFCDCTNHAKELSLSFAEFLGKKYYTSLTTVDYYTAYLSIPGDPKVESYHFAHKSAFFFSYTGNQNKEESFKLAGRAKDFRHRFSLNRELSVFGSNLDQLMEDFVEFHLEEKFEATLKLLK